MKNVKRIEMAAGFLCCLLGILFIGIGGENNYRAKKIMDNGVRVQAIILERDVQRRIPVPGQHMKYVSMVKFSVGEQERIGKAVSSHAVFRGDYVNIYYLPDSTDEVDIFLWTVYTCSYNDLYCRSIFLWIQRHLLAAV